MSDAINQFYDSIESVKNITQKDLVCFFVYFLTVECGQNSVKPKDISQCFSDCHLEPSKRIAAYLSEGYKSKPRKFIKSKDGGYKLERHQREEIAVHFDTQENVRQVSKDLKDLEEEINYGPAKNFLKETLDCFKVGANRATIVMIWIFVIEHLYSYILVDKGRLAEFNKALTEDLGARTKMKKVTKRDDFCEIPEGKFINFCKKARIINTRVSYD